MKKLKTWMLIAAVWLGMAPAAARADTITIVALLESAVTYLGTVSASTWFALALTAYPASGLAGCRRSLRYQGKREATP